MLTLLKEIWLVPLLLALSLLAIWLIAQRWKRKSPKIPQPIKIEEPVPAIVQAADEFTGVVSRSLSGMEDHDFQSLHTPSSKLAKLGPADFSAGRTGQDDEESEEFADLDEDADFQEFDARESTDRSFDAREDLEPLVFPRPPEPPLVLSNDLYRPTRIAGKSPAAGSVAKTGPQYRRDAPQSIKPDALCSTLPPRIPRAAPAAISADAATAEKADNNAAPAPLWSDESNEEPTFAMPKYILTPHRFLAHAFDAVSEPSADRAVRDKLSAELAEVSQQRDAALAENSRLIAQIEKIQSAAAAAETLFVEWQAESHTAQGKLVRLEQEKLDWLDRLLEANQRLAETGVDAAQVKQLTDYCNELSARLATLASESTVAESRTASFQEDATQAKAQAARLLAERDALQARLAAVMEQLQAEKDRRSELAISKTILESSLAALTNQLARNESERKQLHDDLDAATRSLAQANQKQNALENAVQAAGAVDLQAAELQAAELQAIRDEAERLQQEQQPLLEQITSLQSGKTRDQLELEKLRSLITGREQELLSSRGELASSRTEAEELGKQLAEHQRPVDSEEDLAKFAEIELRADELEEVARQSASRVESLSQQLVEMESSAAEQQSQLSAANSLVSQLQVELQGAEDTARFLELARDEAIHRLEQQRIERRTVAESLQQVTRRLEEQNQQMERLAAERQALTDQLQMVRRDQEVAVSERNRFQKELTQSGLNATRLQTYCQAYLHQANQLHEEKVALLRQLQTIQKTASRAVQAKETEQLARANLPDAPDAELVSDRQAIVGSSETGDDLTRISGIGKVLAGKLRGAGVSTFEQIMNWDQQTIESLTRQLGLRGRIQRDGWVEQAARFVRESQAQEKASD